MVRICVLLLVFCAYLSAETIASIDVKPTTQAMNKEALRSLVNNCVGTRPGMELNAKQLAEDIKKLVLSGKVEDVHTQITRNAQGKIIVTYVITPKPIISSISFSGNREFSDKDLIKKLKIAVGEQVDEEAIAESRKEMLKKYTDDGYYGAEIKTARVTDEDGNVKLTFIVREPEHSKLHKVYFKNNTAFTESELRDIVETKRQWWRYIIRVGNYYNPELHPMDKDKLRQAYSQKGYMDFQVAEVQIDKIEDGDWTDVTFILNEGKPYTVSKLSIEGNKVVPTDKLMAAMLTKVGNVHDSERENKDLDRMKALYEVQGYMDLKMYPVYEKDTEKHTVHVIFRVSEGSVSRIRFIGLSGNQVTRDDVVRRELTIAPEDLGDNGKIRNSKRRLENLGYFSSVEIMPTDTEEPGYKDLHIELKEKPTGQLSLGAGFSTEDSAIGFIEFSENNFDLQRLLRGEWPPKGDGQKLRVRLQIGSSVSSVVISHTEPWFLDRRLELNTELFMTNRYEDEYRERHYGISQMISWPVAFRIPFTDHTESWRLGVGYKLERVRINEVDTHWLSSAKAEDGYVKDRILAQEDGYYTVPKLVLRATRDTRDAFMFPTQGSKITLQGEIMSEGVGAYESYGRLSADAAKYFPLHERLTLKVGAGYYTNTNEDAAIFDRYFAGGLGSVRGYERRYVSPFDIYSDHLGGNSMVNGTVELVTPVQNLFYVCVFMDAGNAWWNSYNIKLDDLCYSVGIGIQLKVFPFNIYYGFPVKTCENYIESKSGRLHFNMGFNF